jgi:hypothetical protein
VARYASEAALSDAKRVGNFRHCHLTLYRVNRFGHLPSPCVCSLLFGHQIKRALWFFPHRQLQRFLVLFARICSDDIKTISHPVAKFGTNGFA